MCQYALSSVCSNDLSVVVVLSLGRQFVLVHAVFLYGFVLGRSKLECYGSWQVVLLSWLVLLVTFGVKLLPTLVVILALLVYVLGAHAELLVPTSGVKIV